MCHIWHDAVAQTEKKTTYQFVPFPSANVQIQKKQWDKYGTKKGERISFGCDNFGMPRKSLIVDKKSHCIDSLLLDHVIRRCYNYKLPFGGDICDAFNKHSFYRTTFFFFWNGKSIAIWRWLYTIFQFHGIIIKIVWISMRLFVTMKTIHKTPTIDWKSI